MPPLDANQRSRKRRSIGSTLVYTPQYAPLTCRRTLAERGAGTPGSRNDVPTRTTLHERMASSLSRVLRVAAPRSARLPAHVTAPHRGRGSQARAVDRRVL